MKVTEKINRVSENYRKYLMKIKLNGSNFFMIMGDDLSDNLNEKLLVDKEDKVIVSEKFHSLVKFVKTSGAFDESNLKKWLKNIQPLIAAQLRYKYALYNFDVLVQDFILNIEGTLKELPQRNCKEFIDFVNLTDSFANQTNNGKLIKLRQDKNIEILWEYFYDIFVWKIQLNEKQKKKALGYFDSAMFRIVFSKIYSLFLSNLRYL